MMAKSPRMRISTSCSRMFLTEEPRPICARKALRSMKLPSGLVFEELMREVGVKPGDIGFIHGSDVVAVELLQLGAMLLVVGHGFSSLSLGRRNVAKAS